MSLPMKKTLTVLVCLSLVPMTAFATSWFSRVSHGQYLDRGEVISP